MRELWNAQRDAVRRRAQGDKTPFKWNVVVMRMAMAIYCRSRSAYNALRDGQVIDLPHERTLRRHVSAGKYQSNCCDPRLFSNAKAMFTDYQKNPCPSKSAARTGMEEEQVPEQKQQLIPKAEGSLMFDEATLTAGLVLVARRTTASLVGFGCTPDELTSLTDITASDFAEGPTKKVSTAAVTYTDSVPGCRSFSSFIETSHPALTSSDLTFSIRCVHPC